MNNKPEYQNNKDIEPRIKPLVDILNKIPGIETDSSCEGHFGNDTLIWVDGQCFRREGSATVYFNKNTKFEEWDELKKAILSQTADYKHASVEMDRSFHCIDGFPPRSSYGIKITPHESDIDNQLKRQYLDTAIQKVIDTIKLYAQSQGIILKPKPQHL